MKKVLVAGATGYLGRFTVQEFKSRITSYNVCYTKLLRTPVVIDETADIKRAVASILMSKTFDNGVVCASEQAVIVVDAVYDAVKERFASHGGYILNKDEADKVRKVLLINGALNAAIVGQPATKIAELAGIKVPADTKILVGEGVKICHEEEFAHEKLSPSLGMFRAKDFTEAVDMACQMVDLGGIGHTSALYTDQDKNDRNNFV